MLGLPALLVVTRIAALVLVTPWLGGQRVPWLLRVALCLAIGLLVVPGQLAAPLPEPIALEAAAPSAAWLGMFAREAAIGCGLGLSMLLLVAAIQLAGEIMSRLSGLPPASDEDTASALGRLTQLTCIGLLLAAGGHRLLIEALLQSFADIPLGAAPEASWLAGMVQLAGVSVEFGLRAALPVAAAAGGAQVLLAMLARVLPTLRTAAQGPTAAALAGAGVWLLSIGGLGWLALDELDVLLATVQNIFAGVAP